MIFFTIYAGETRIYLLVPNVLFLPLIDIFSSNPQRCFEYTVQSSLLHLEFRLVNLQHPQTEAVIMGL